MPQGQVLGPSICPRHGRKGACWQAGVEQGLTGPSHGAQDCWVHLDGAEVELVALSTRGAAWGPGRGRGPLPAGRRDPAPEAEAGEGARAGSSRPLASAPPRAAHSRGAPGL